MSFPYALPMPLSAWVKYVAASVFSTVGLPVGTQSSVHVLSSQISNRKVLRGKYLWFVSIVLVLIYLKKLFLMCVSFWQKALEETKNPRKLRELLVLVLLLKGTIVHEVS